MTITQAFRNIIYTVLELSKVITLNFVNIATHQKQNKSRLVSQFGYVFAITARRLVWIWYVMATLIWSKLLY